MYVGQKFRQYIQKQKNSNSLASKNGWEKSTDGRAGGVARWWKHQRQW